MHETHAQQHPHADERDGIYRAHVLHSSAENHKRKNKDERKDEKEPAAWRLVFGVR